jgi:hypothetical protein
MSITTSGEFIVKISSALGSSSSLLESGEMEFVALQTLNELGWSYPIDNGKKEFWCIERGKRHALDMLRVQSAHRFKYKQINLGQRFDHYDKMIKDLDEKFEKALDNDPILMDVDMNSFFGVYVENGFVYDQFGNDVTKYLYDSGVDNEGYRHRIL